MSSNARSDRGPMTVSDWKIQILQLAEREELPEFIENDSIAPRRYFRELYDAGWLTGWECPSDGNPDDFQRLRISQPGRDGLRSLLAERREVAPVARVKRTGIKTFLVISALVGFVGGLIAIIDWWIKINP